MRVCAPFQGVSSWVVLPGFQPDSPRPCAQAGCGGAGGVDGGGGGTPAMGLGLAGVAAKVGLWGPSPAPAPPPGSRGCWSVCSHVFAMSGI